MLNKRGKVVRDMCEQILVKFHQDVESAEWGRLFEIAPPHHKHADVVQLMETQLREQSTKEPEFYNDDGKLGRAISAAVNASAVGRWPQLIQLVADKAEMDVQACAPRVTHVVVASAVLHSSSVATVCGAPGHATYNAPPHPLGCRLSLPRRSWTCVRRCWRTRVRSGVLACCFSARR